MAMTNKIKVHDIAKSFNLPSKDIMNILSEYSTPPKSHSAVMTEEEISIVLDYLTQKNQISSIEVIFADSFQAEAHSSAESTSDGAGRNEAGRRRRRKVLCRQKRRESPRTGDSPCCAGDFPRA